MKINEGKMCTHPEPNIVINRETNYVEVGVDISFGSSAEKVNDFKTESERKLINSSEKWQLINQQQYNEAGLKTPTNKVSMGKEGRRKYSIYSGTSSKMSLSSPRRKRDLLASLQSDLSPKYIGFTTPPSLSGVLSNGSESDSGLQTRSARNRKLLVYGPSPDAAVSDSELATDIPTTLLGSVRRTHYQGGASSPNRLSARRHFESPIDKLLVRNGSMVISGMYKAKILTNLESSPKTEFNNLRSEYSLSPIEVPIKTDSFASNFVNLNGSIVENCESEKRDTSICKATLSIKEHNVHLSSENSTLDTCKVKREVLRDVQTQPIEAKTEQEDNTQMTCADELKVQLPGRHSMEDVDVDRIKAIKRESEGDQNIEFNSESIGSHIDCTGVVLQYDLDAGESSESVILGSAVGLSAKSPSALSLDSAKGSSVTGLAWMSFTTGDLFWGQIYSYCYWPCMVCPDPDGKTITTERNLRNGEGHVLVHVRFFADSGRRNWVKSENLIPYTDLESYKQQMREIRKKYGKNSHKYKLLLPKPGKVTIWRDAIKEANKVAEVLYDERLAKFYELYEHKKFLQKLQRKHRKFSRDNCNTIGSFRYDSMDNFIVKNPLGAVKRDRSTSPFSPAYSPLKSISNIKRRKLSDASNQHLQPLESSCKNSTETLDVSRNVIVMDTMDDACHISSSFTSLHEKELSSSGEYKKFYNAMKDFVLENHKDDNLERSLIVAVRNIWALKQINRTKLQRRLQADYNEHELGSSMVGNGRGQGTVKRLSNRLKGLKLRNNLPSQNRSIAIDSIAQTDGPKVELTLYSEGPHFGNKTRRQLNRPIEEVIDDIFNLDSKYLFRGLSRDPICKYCFQPSSSLVRCAKGCHSWLHVDCIDNVQNVDNIKNHSGRRNKSITGDETRESLKLSNNAKTGLVTQSALLTMEEEYDHVTADIFHNTTDATEIICDSCARGMPATCWVCNGVNTPVIGTEELVVCNMQQCSKAFHPACCRYWPQAKFTKSKNKIESFRCPSHVCHTCVSDDPKSKFQHLSSAKLTKCVKCPASYHTDSTCIPAGSQILTAGHIICPRHNTSNKSDASINVSWCFICVGGGQVVCCETCPTAVHAKCLNIALDPSEAYICEECESGRMPLYGEMVWAKFNSFRWWPAIILPPTEVPQNIKRKVHNPNDFVVRFFGTHDHGWISRRRVYLYLEGDSSEPPKTKSSLDQSYNRGVVEAKRIYEIIKSKKLSQRLSNEGKEKLHPQPYVRIKANRAVHPVKLHIDLEKVSKCECKLDSEDPCGPSSNCLNRVLYHECNPKVCPAGNRCQNQMFESRLSPRLDVVYMKERGFGLVCRESICAGTFVIEYVGEIINDNEFKQRMSQKSLDRDENFYFLSVEKDYIIDAGPKGNLARFMNHSCDPNCEAQKWSVNGLNRIGLFAIKDISADTELTFNYHWDDLLGNEKKICLCGANKCAGEIGAKHKEEKASKDHCGMDVNKVQTVTIRKTKPLKRLQKHAREEKKPGVRKKPAKSHKKLKSRNVQSEYKANISSKLKDHLDEVAHRSTGFITTGND